MAILAGPGRIGKEPELKYLGETPLLKFSLALDSGYGDKKITSWWNCSFFGKRAEKMAEMLSKGKEIYVEGEPTLRPYEKDGEKRISADLRVGEIKFIGGRNDNQQSPVDNGGAGNDDDQVPF